MSALHDALGILLPAMIAGVLVVLSHVPLGLQVLARGIVFIDLAVAQVAGLGVILAHALGLAGEGWGTQAAAVVAALLGSLLLTWTERRRPEVQEALIGVLFVLASTAQILLLANDPHGGEDLKDLLAGQILWVSASQLWRAAALTALFVLVWWRWREQVGRAGFYVLFALVVTVSVQMVGVYLVFSSLIVPALAVYRFPARQRLGLGLALSVVSYGAGLLLSALLDLPASPMIVWTMALAGTAIHLLAPRRQGEPVHGVV
ncbi:MAG: metal ABC transporter permease [Steroidobacteraceae bacterium]